MYLEPWVFSLCSFTGSAVFRKKLVPIPGLGILGAVRAVFVVVDAAGPQTTSDYHNHHWL